MRRIEDALDRHGLRFAQRILGESEFPVFQARFGKVRHKGIKYLATRFAAKEAFSKAIGLGITVPMTWRRCEVLKKPSGQPYIALHGELKQWCEQRKLQAHISITDETLFALAFVVVEVTE